MAILNVGGEDSDWTVIGSFLTAPSMLNTAGRFRTVARGGLQFAVATANVATTWLRQLFPSAQTSFWATFRVIHLTTTQTANFTVLGFGKSNTRRLALIATSTAGRLALAKIGTGGITTLATETGGYISTTLNKYDIQVLNYGASGTVNVWRANADGTGSTLIITFTGDLTTDGITDLDSVYIQGFSQNNGNFQYSEVIVADEDTRGMGLVTLEPNANGNTYQWSGSFTDVNELTLNDATVITSAANNDIAQFAFNSSRIGTPPAIKCLAIAARGQSGGTLTTFTPNVRIASTDYYGTGIVPGTGLKPVQAFFYNNPNTGVPFTASQLTTAGVNYGYRANT